MTDIYPELRNRGDHPGKPHNSEEDPVVPPDRKSPPVKEPPKRRREAPEIEDPRPPKPKKITRDG